VSDRTSFHCYVYRCPGKRAARRVAELLSGFELDQTSQPRPELDLSLPYTEPEVSLGYGEELAADIIAAAPKACFVMWEDPAYEWLGVLYAYHPRLGLFQGDCDNSGEVVLSRPVIARVILDVIKGVPARQGGTMLRQIRAAIDAAAGGPWIDDWKAAQARRGRAAAQAASAAAAAALRREQAIQAAAQAVLDVNMTTRACLLPGPESLTVTARRWIASTGALGWAPAGAGGEGEPWVFTDADVPAITAAARKIAASAAEETR